MVTENTDYCEEHSWKRMNPWDKMQFLKNTEAQNYGQLK